MKILRKDIHGLGIVASDWFVALEKARCIVVMLEGEQIRV